MGFGNNGLAKANLHGANDQKVLAGGDRESVGAGFTDSGGGHNNTAPKLASVANSSYISKMATGQMNISDYTARAIERALELPEGWMDRDNISILNMSLTQSQIHFLVSKLTIEKQTALFNFLSPDGL
ncbi:hypothetical protein RVM27_03820 [Halomonas sp. KM007]